jgi:glycosyltransferase 2 family protein
LKKSHLGIGVGLASLAAAAWVGYRWRTSGFAWGKFKGSLSNLDWRWMAAGVALILITYFGRALRWEVMLRPLREGILNPAGLWDIFSATAIGFTAVVLFGRAGEPVRPYLIAKKQGVPFSSQVAAWVVERILDLLMVLLIFGIALSQVSHSTLQPGHRMRLVLQASGYTAGLAGAVSLTVLVALRQFRGRVQRRLTDALSFLPERFAGRIGKFLAAFEEGMQSTRSAWFAFLLLLYTVLEWVVIAAAFWCVLKAFPDTRGLGLTEVVILLGFVCFGSVLQLPGVGGGMQIAAALVLTEFFGLTLESATGIAVVLWLVTFVAIVPVGLILAFHEGVQWRNLRHLDTSAEGKT